MAVDWRLGVPQGDAGQSFQQGYQNALAVREHQQDRALQQQQRDMQMQQAQQTQQFQVTDRHRQDIRLGAGIARQIERQTGRPMDEAGWQAVRAAAQQAGADLTGVPEHFDPNYYQGLLAAGAQIEAQAQRQQAPTTLQRNDEYIRSQYGDPAGDQYMSRQVAPPPITQHNADGTITIIPQAGAPIHRQGQHGGGQAPPPPQVGEVRRGYRFRGGDPADPQSWEPASPVQTSSVDARPPNDPAPAFHPDPNSIPSGNPLDPNLRRY